MFKIAKPIETLPFVKQSQVSHLQRSESEKVNAVKEQKGLGLIHLKQLCRGMNIGEVSQASVLTTMPCCIVDSIFYWIISGKQVTIRPP
jgi:hypothetical protein